MFVSDPIFSPDDDETVSLSEIYLKLRCFWSTRTESSDETIKITSHVRDLHTTAKDWLLNSSDQLRVVGGGPGSGKSSFAKGFAQEVVQDDSHRVIFVELQHLTFKTELYEALGAYLERSNKNTGEDGSAGFYENPLKWAADDDTPILLIFDGLDELSAQDIETRVLTKNFMDAVRSLLSSCSIPDDHIAPRRSALFMARCILTEARDGRATC